MDLQTDSHTDRTSRTGFWSTALSVKGHALPTWESTYHQDTLFRWAFDKAVRTVEIERERRRANIPEEELRRAADSDGDDISSHASIERAAIHSLLGERDQTALAVWTQFESIAAGLARSGLASHIWDVLDPTSEYQSRAGQWPRARTMAPLFHAVGARLSAVSQLFAKGTDGSFARDHRRIANFLRMVMVQLDELAERIHRAPEPTLATAGLLRKVPALSLVLVPILLLLSAIVGWLGSLGPFLLFWLVVAGVIVIAEWVIFRDQRNLSLAARVEQDPRMVEIGHRIDAADDALQSSLYDKGMVPFLRTELNRRLGEVYVTDLNIDSSEAPGLHQLPESSLLVPTRPIEKVRGLMELMGSSGSIGISGPRGAGKSTLIDTICRDDPETGVVAVRVDAPVEYSSRDFLLHLFAETCRKVRGPERRHLSPGEWPPSPHVRIGRIGSYAVAVGSVASVFVIVFGMEIAVGPISLHLHDLANLVWLLPNPNVPQSWIWTVNVLLDTSIISGLLIAGSKSSGMFAHGLRLLGFFAACLQIGLIVQQAIPGVLPAANLVRLKLIRPILNSLLRQAWIQHGVGPEAAAAIHQWTRSVEHAGISPVFVLLAIVAAVLLASRQQLIHFGSDSAWLMPNYSPWPNRLEGLLAIALISVGIIPRLPPTLTQGPGVYVVSGLILAGVGALARTGFGLSRADVWARYSRSLQSIPRPGLYQLASQRLEQIRYQMSRTSGWSASVRVPGPVGIETGITGSRSLTENPQSLPELVADFREFITSVLSVDADEEQTNHPWRRTESGNRLIIGIDELDKIESEEKAHRFINDVKAVFRIPRTFYLVSVSEDAMASFERRGMPLRDAFDSSLDDVVKVDYLEYDDACRFMNARVIGFPRPFLALAYVSSAGLARDLIRATRHMIELSERGSGGELDRIAKELMRNELQNKTAMVIKAAAALKTSGDDLARWCARIQPRSVDYRDLIEHSLEAAQVLVENPDMDGETARSLCELATFEYFCGTVMEFFCEYRQRRLQCAESLSDDMRSLNQLAAARQAFAINTALAWAKVSSFRVAWEMKGVDDFPLLAARSARIE